MVGEGRGREPSADSVNDAGRRDDRPGDARRSVACTAAAAGGLAHDATRAIDPDPERRMEIEHEGRQASVATLPEREAELDDLVVS
jgi:hypothetical protein